MYTVDGVDQDWHLFNHGAMAYIIEGSHHNPQDMAILQCLSGTPSVRSEIECLEHLSSGPAILNSGGRWQWQSNPSQGHSGGPHTQQWRVVAHSAPRWPMGLLRP